MEDEVTIDSLARMPDVQLAIHKAARHLGAERWSTRDIVYSNFSNPTYDSTRFSAFTNFTYTTDGSIPAIQSSNHDASSGFATLKAYANYNLRIRYRSINDGKYGTNFGVALFGSQNENGQITMNTGMLLSSSGSAFSQILYGSQQVSYFPRPNIANTTESRYLEIDKRGSVIRAREWFTDTDPPEYAVVAILDDSQGMNPMGVAGIISQYNTHLISEFRLVELIRTDGNLLFNPHLDPLITNTQSGPSANGLPYLWTPNIAPSLATFGIDNIVDPFGDTRNVLKIVRPTTGDTGGGMYQQTVRGAIQSGRYGAQVAQQPLLESVLPRNVEVSVWSMAQAISSPTMPVLGAAAVVYEYDTNGASINQATPNYYSSLGPNGHVGAPQNSGQGSWGWYRNVWRFTLNPATVNLQINLGIHDGNTTGTFWACDPQMIAVN